MDSKSIRSLFFDYGIPCAAAVGVGLAAYILTGGKEEYPPVLASNNRGVNDDGEFLSDDDENGIGEVEGFRDGFEEGHSIRNSRSRGGINASLDDVLSKLDEQMAAFSQSSLDIVKKIDDQIVFNAPPWATELLKKTDQLDLEIKQVKQMLLRQQQLSNNTSNSNSENAPSLQINTNLQSSTTSGTTSSTPTTPSNLVKRHSIGTDPTIPLPLSHYLHQVQAAIMCLALQREDVEPSNEEQLKTWIQQLEAGQDPSNIEVKKMTSATETMTLFIKTLLKQPEVPRYRKIAATNFAFKNSLAGLLGIDRLFTATGFTLRGNYWEWDWYVSSDALNALTQSANGTTASSSGSGTPSRVGKNGPPPPSKEEWTQILQLAVDSLAMLKANQKAELLKLYLPGGSLRLQQQRPSLVTAKSIDSESNIETPANSSAIPVSSSSAGSNKGISNGGENGGKLPFGIAISDSSHAISPSKGIEGFNEQGVSLLPSGEEEKLEAPLLVADTAISIGLTSSGPGPLKFEDILKTVQSGSNNS